MGVVAYEQYVEDALLITKNEDMLSIVVSAFTKMFR